MLKVSYFAAMTTFKNAHIKIIKMLKCYGDLCQNKLLVSVVMSLYTYHLASLTILVGKCKHTPYLQPLVYILSSGDCARNVEQSLFFQQ